MTMCTYCGKQGHSASTCRLTRKAGVIAAVGVSFVLGACSGTPAPPSEIIAPSARLMVPPTDPTPPKPGDDLVAKHLDTVNQCVADNGRFRSLQGYVKTVRGAR